MTVTARIRILLLALLALLTLAAPLAAAQSDDGSAGGPRDNQALAEASGAGDSVIDLAFSVRENASEVIDESNSAVAYANCEACRAVAIAFQIVIVQGDPNTVTPTNVAVAVNSECPGCSTLAIAYQFVVGRGEPVEFTKEGLKRLEKIRKEFAKLEKQYPKLTNEEIVARTDAFAAEIRDILATELVPVDQASKKNDKRIDREDKADDTGEGTTTAPAQSAPPQPPSATPPPPPTETAPTATTPVQPAPAPEETQDPTMTTTTP